MEWVLRRVVCHRFLEAKFVDDTLASVSDIMELETSLFVVRDEEAEVHCKVVSQRQ